MTHQITEITTEKKYEVAVDFADENIELQGETTVLGTEQQAQRYARTFGADLKENNAHLWPEPDYPEEEMLPDIPPPE